MRGAGEGGETVAWAAAAAGAVTKSEVAAPGSWRHPEGAGAQPTAVSVKPARRAPGHPARRGSRQGDVGAHGAHPKTPRLGRPRRGRTPTQSTKPPARTAAHGCTETRPRPPTAATAVRPCSGPAADPTTTRAARDGSGTTAAARGSTCAPHPNRWRGAPRAPLARPGACARGARGGGETRGEGGVMGWQGGGSSRQRCGPPRAALWNAAPSRAWRGTARHPRPRATPRVWRRGCGERGGVGRTRAARGGGGAARCDEEDGARRHHRWGVHRGRLRWRLWGLVRAHPPRRPTWKPGPTDATRDGPSSAAAAAQPAPQHTRGACLVVATRCPRSWTRWWRVLSLVSTGLPWHVWVAAAVFENGRRGGGCRGGGVVATATVPALAAPLLR